MTENLREIRRLVRALYGDLEDFPFFRPHETIAPGGISNTAPASALATPPCSAIAAPTAPATQADLNAYAESIRFCTDCPGHIGRKNLVFGRGNPRARVVFVGDIPSDKDDACGRIFSDEAGDLLEKMILAMKLRPEGVYLVNLFQCRPPNGIALGETEQRICDKHFMAQIRAIRPEYVIALGERAARALARSDISLAALRKQALEFGDAKLQCTHHPRDLLKNPGKKKEAWEDLQVVMRGLARGRA